MQPQISEDIQAYNQSLSAEDCEIFELLAKEISTNLSEASNKIWHRHPVWFLDGNPIVGYSRQKAGVRLMFWSGQSFDEEGLSVKGGKFQDASIFYSSVDAVNRDDLKALASEIQNNPVGL